MKDSIYFSHDADARNDEKIIGLIMEHGMEGYGIFWSIVEMLRTATDHKMHLEYKRIAFALHVDDAKVENVIHGFELFESDEHFFWSASLLRRMNMKNIVSEERRKAARSRWDKAKAMQLHSKSNANEMQVQCNKEKKESKERKKEKEESPKPPKGATLATAKSFLQRNKIDWIPQDVWDEWCEHKKRLKCALTDRAMGMNVKTLESLGRRKAEFLLSTSMNRGWKDIYEAGVFEPNKQQQQTLPPIQPKDRLVPIHEQD